MQQQGRQHTLTSEPMPPCTSVHHNGIANKNVNMPQWPEALSSTALGTGPPSSVSVFGHTFSAGLDWTVSSASAEVIQTWYARPPSLQDYILPIQPSYREESIAASTHEKAHAAILQGKQPLQPDSGDLNMISIIMPFRSQPEVDHLSYAPMASSIYYNHQLGRPTRSFDNYSPVDDDVRHSEARLLLANGDGRLEDMRSIL